MQLELFLPVNHYRHSCSEDCIVITVKLASSTPSIRKVHKPIEIMTQIQ